MVVVWTKTYNLKKSFVDCVNKSYICWKVASPSSNSTTIDVFTDLQKRLFGAVRVYRQQGEVVPRMRRREASSIISASTGASHPTVSGGFSSSTSTVRYYSRFLPFSAQIRHKQDRLGSTTARVASLTLVVVRRLRTAGPVVFSQLSGQVCGLTAAKKGAVTDLPVCTYRNVYGCMRAWWT